MWQSSTRCRTWSERVTWCYSFSCVYEGGRRGVFCGDPHLPSSPFPFFLMTTRRYYVFCFSFLLLHCPLSTCVLVLFSFGTLFSPVFVFVPVPVCVCVNRCIRAPALHLLILASLHLFMLPFHSAPSPLVRLFFVFLLLFSCLHDFVAFFLFPPFFLCCFPSPAAAARPQPRTVRALLTLPEAFLSLSLSPLSSLLHR